MTKSSRNRIVAAIKDSTICIGLAKCPAIPSSASTRQISFRIDRVAISIIATYTNNRISRHKAVGTIQFIKCMPESRRGIGTSNATLWTQRPVMGLRDQSWDSETDQLWKTSHSAGDRAEPG